MARRRPAPDLRRRRRRRRAAVLDSPGSSASVVGRFGGVHRRRRGSADAASSPHRACRRRLSRPVTASTSAAHAGVGGARRWPPRRRPRGPLRAPLRSRRLHRRLICRRGVGGCDEEHLRRSPAARRRRGCLNLFVDSGTVSGGAARRERLRFVGAAAGSSAAGWLSAASALGAASFVAAPLAGPLARCRLLGRLGLGDGRVGLGDGRVGGGAAAGAVDFAVDLRARAAFFAGAVAGAAVFSSAGGAAFFAAALRGALLVLVAGLSGCGSSDIPVLAGLSDSSMCSGHSVRPPGAACERGC